jgi:hypothetical protein
VRQQQQSQQLIAEMVYLYRTVTYYEPLTNALLNCFTNNAATLSHNVVTNMDIVNQHIPLVKHANPKYVFRLSYQITPHHATLVVVRLLFTIQYVKEGQDSYRYPNSGYESVIIPQNGFMIHGSIIKPIHSYFMSIMIDIGNR